MFNPPLFIALGLVGVYTIKYGVVGILPAVLERYQINPSQAGLLSWRRRNVSRHRCWYVAPTMPP